MTGRIWTPRADQEAVLAFGHDRSRWGLFAPTGAGKTAMLSTWVEAALNDAFVGRVLIVAPPIPAREGWPGEWGRWSHLRYLRDNHRVLVASDFGLEPGVLVVSDDDAWETMWSDLTPLTQTYARCTRMALTFSDKRATKRHLQSLRERVHVVPWFFWPWLVKAYGSNFPYQGVVFDESSFLRDYSAERNKAARHALGRVGRVTHVALASASPADNHEDALFAQVDFIAPGLLGTGIGHFREMWCEPDTRDRRTGQVWSWKVRAERRPELAALVGRHCVSVPSSLGVPLVKVDHRSVPDEAVRVAHEAMKRTGVCDVGGRRVVGKSAGVVHAKLRQIASGFVYDSDNALEEGKVLRLSNSKIDALEEMLETEPGQVLIGYEFQEERRRLKQALGSGFADIRDSGAKSAFEAGKLKALGVHPASAGHGVDGLQHVCNQVHWMTVPQDEELHGQLNGRVHRHGTEAETVFAHYHIAAGTREESIFDEVLTGKRHVADLLLAGISV